MEPKGYRRILVNNKGEPFVAVESDCGFQLMPEKNYIEAGYLPPVDDLEWADPSPSDRKGSNTSNLLR